MILAQLHPFPPFFLAAPRSGVARPNVHLEWLKTRAGSTDGRTDAMRVGGGGSSSPVPHLGLIRSGEGEQMKQKAEPIKRDKEQLSGSPQGCI